MVDKRWYLTSVPIVAFTVIFIGILLPVFLKQRSVNRGSANYEVLYSQGALDGSAIYLLVLVSNMNTLTYELTTSASIQSLAPDLYNNATNTLNKAVRIQLNSDLLMLTNTTAAIDTAITSTASIVEGSIAWYPFDKYTTRLDVAAATGVAAFNGSDSSPVPVDIIVAQHEDFEWNYNVKFSPLDTMDAKTIGQIPLEVSVRRSINMYTVLVFFGIWAVTFSIAYIGSLAVIWKRRAPDNPVIFISALFAIPAFRNTCPGNPPYGVLFDIIGTYIAIAVTCTFLVLVSIAYMKPKPPAVQNP
ncbi:unnamed protein product [Aphanomyces euteiches]|uniref:DUF4436 domain-containing protein n=1 Tax=Aphanomyces euteiches TaxID=100861 RepID=A0A6G0WRI7_9STRA|nr:hypothetical protein Ae201684_012503 [Aphanomyces euteiches]KAH9090580.1 hypothetical protein Ae201684P_014378 [Aphanomyces euteiches]KAH9110705.1 hypothetical protein LEN26_013647 [Aphanomyces euteiches]KAH9114610.1 hypothetical protein AeMF1_011317 [Aphanomyces euteiches]KAH9140523.1 hypothetical protein AeRB84_015249 [Aphanomyces euteiches]